MLGRQRLDENPFKYNAIIYYRTKPSVKSEREYLMAIEDKLKASQTLVDNYNSGDDGLKKSLANLVKGQDPNNRYRNNYLEVINDANGNYSLSINLLVAAAEHNLSVNKAHYYSNPLFLTTAIHFRMEGYNAKPQELRDFERKFNNAQTFTDKMVLYCSFLDAFPNYSPILQSNPFIEQKYHVYYFQFGPETLFRLNFEEEQIVWEYSRMAITEQCRYRFISGKTYTATEVKTTLQDIYDNLSLNKAATAAQLSDYLTIETVQRTLHDGTRPRLYLIK